MNLEESSRWCGSASRRDGKSFTITPAQWSRRRLSRNHASENFQDFFVALERRNEIGAGKFGPRPREHVACDFETAIARGGSGGFHGFQKRIRNHDAGYFVVQAQRLLVTVERPDAD